MIIKWLGNNLDHMKSLKMAPWQIICYFFLAMLIHEIFISPPEILGQKGGYGYGNVIAFCLSPLLSSIELATCISLIFIVAKSFDNRAKYREILFIYPYIQLFRVPFFFVAMSSSLIAWSVRFEVEMVGLCLCTVIMIVACNKILQLNLVASIASSLTHLAFIVGAIYLYQVYIVPKIAAIVDKF